MINSIIIKKGTLAAALLCASLTAGAQQHAYEMIAKTDYLLYFPQEYEADTAAKWPMVVCLHGGAETKNQSGQGIDIVRKIGYAKYIEEEGRQHPFIVLSPQADNGWDKRTIIKLIDKVMEEHRVDPDRVYLTGLSMGGGGTWEIAQAYPEYFAAIAPICGYSSDTSHLWTLAHMPIWAHHGDKDDVLPIKHAETMVNAIRKYNPDNIRFSVWEGHGHHIYFDIYKGDDLWQWFLTHTRNKEIHKAVELSDPSILQSYVGKYRNEDSQNIEITLDEGRLKASWGWDLYPLSDTTFYYNPEWVEFIEFRQNPQIGKMEILLYFTHATNVLQKVD